MIIKLCYNRFESHMRKLFTGMKAVILLNRLSKYATVAAIIKEWLGKVFTKVQSRFI